MKTLYVGNISYQATAADVEALFTAVGAVVSVRLVTDPETGRPRGFAFVEMVDDVVAAAALDKFNGFEWQGQVLTVRPAREAGGEAA